MKSIFQKCAIAIWMIGLASGCSAWGGASPDTEKTAAAMTLHFILTDAVSGNPSPTAGFMEPTPTFTMFATSTLPEILTPTLSLTATVPGTPCYRAGWVGDISVPDGTNFEPGEVFVKTWRLFNNGSCDWESTVQVVFVTGDQMGGPSAQAIGREVKIGEPVDISVTLKAPMEPKQYQGYWMLRGPGGGRFGLGVKGDGAFYVLIVVRTGTVTATLTPTATGGTPTQPQSTDTPTDTPTATPTATLPDPLPTETTPETPAEETPEE